MKFHRLYTPSQKQRIDATLYGQSGMWLLLKPRHEVWGGEDRGSFSVRVIRITIIDRRGAQVSIQ